MKKLYFIECAIRCILREMFRTRFILAAVVCGLIMPTYGWCAPRTLDELSSEAQLILVGKVEKLVCRRDPDQRMITEVTLLVQDLWKGTHPARHITLVQAGGILGGIRQEFPYENPYRIGETGIYFLEKSPIGYWLTVSLGQGRFLIQCGDDDLSDSCRVSNCGFSTDSSKGLTIDLNQFRNTIQIHFHDEAQ
jgi:hypothetical protein